MDRNVKLLAIVLGLAVATAAAMSQFEAPQLEEAAVEGPALPPPGSLDETTVEEAPPPPPGTGNAAVGTFGQPMSDGQPFGQGNASSEGSVDVASGADSPPDGFEPNIAAVPPASSADGGFDGSSGPAPAPVDNGF